MLLNINPPFIGSNTYYATNKLQTTGSAKRPSAFGSSFNINTILSEEELDTFNRFQESLPEATQEQQAGQLDALKVKFALDKYSAWKAKKSAPTLSVEYFDKLMADIHELGNINNLDMELLALARSYLGLTS